MFVINQFVQTMVKTVSSYEARTNLGELINLAYYQGVEVIVERMGKPMVKITRISNQPQILYSKKTAIGSLTGVWKGKDGDVIKAAIKEFRRNGRLIPTRPHANTY